MRKPCLVQHAERSARPKGRSAILDCVVRDADGKQFDVEMQQDTEGASPKRARYHSGLMDMNTLNAGQDFDQLPG